MITMIWAEDAGHGIGLGGKMPWYIPEDYAHFKSQTTGHTVIMGRKTWESLPKKFRPLPERRNIVITHDPGSACAESIIQEGGEVMNFEQVLAFFEQDQVRSESTVNFIIGGGTVYNELMSIADELVVTEVDAVFETDTLAPEIPKSFNRVQTGQWQTSSTVIDEHHLKWRVVKYQR